MQRLPAKLTAVCLALLLAGCSDGTDDAAKGEPDPVTQQALGEQIMVDPDLASQNEGNAALTGGLDGSIPPLNTTPEAVQAAREAAIVLLGGSSGLKELPEAMVLAEQPRSAAPVTAGERAASMPGPASCAAKVSYTAAWAARLPDAFPVYPRGATQEAAGTDADGCALRVVSFHTPVPLEEVLAFYYSRALKAGHRTTYSANAAESLIKGSKGTASVAVHGRTIEGGITEIDLVTKGG